MKYKFLTFVALSGAISIANAQSQVLLEACNAIDNRSKRMECLSDLVRLHTEKTSTGNLNDIKSTAVGRAKAAFAAITEIVRTGVSYNNYSVAILNPAKELGILRQEVPSLDEIALDKLDQSVRAYNDAATVWRASIFQSKDTGIFKVKVLIPELAGLTQIVNRYRLGTTTVLSYPHLPADTAITKIWGEAEVLWKQAFEIVDGLPQTIRVPEAGPIICDKKWGHPKDLNGNPCS